MNAPNFRYIYRSWQKHLLRDEHHSFALLRAKTSLHPNSFYAMDVCDLHLAGLPSDIGIKNFFETPWTWRAHLLCIGAGDVTTQIWPVTEFEFSG